MSEPDVPQRFVDLAGRTKLAALTEAALNERFGNGEIHAGQVWRARRADVSILVLILAVETREVLTAPVTVDPPAEDDLCLVVDGSSTVFGVDATMWAGQATQLPTRALDRAVDKWADEIVRWALMATRGQLGSVPATTRRGRAVASELDPDASVRAELADEVEFLQQAPGLPLETPGASVPDLASLLGGQPDLPLLCSSLGMRQPDVMKLLRGKIPLRPDQIGTIARVTGLAAAKVAQTVRPLPLGLVVAAEHPRWRPVWRERALSQHVDEAEARFVGSYGAFALAARETGSIEPNWEERLRQFLAGEQPSSGGA